jgi:AcrR family transcriptional regulator
MMNAGAGRGSVRAQAMMACGHDARAADGRLDLSIQATKNRAAAPRRTQIERREQSERSLVEAAIAIIGARGVGAMTFESIGKESGYSRSLVTQRFGSKRGLVEAVIAHLHARLVPLFAASGIAKLVGLDSLLGYTELYLREVAGSEELRSYFKLLSSSVADNDELSSAYAEEHERVRKGLAARVRQGQSEGSIRKDLDADAVATLVGSLQLGIAMQLLVDPATRLNPLLAAGVSVLRAGLATGKASKKRGRRDITRPPRKRV